MNKPDEVRQLVNTLAENPLLRDRDGDTTGERDTMLLLGGAAINLALIAEAVAKLVEKNPEPTKPVSLRDLTPEERETIEALRAGDCKVVPVTKAHDLSTGEGLYNSRKGWGAPKWEELSELQREHWKQVAENTLTRS